MSGQEGDEPGESPWFWVERPLAPVDGRLLYAATLPPGILSVRELARRTGRHPEAVAEAVRSGRIPRAGRDARLGLLARASDDDVRRWRAPSLAEALAAARRADPALPDDEAG